MNGQFYTFEGLKYLFNNALTATSLHPFTGTPANGSTSITAVSSVTGLQIGMLIAGANIPAGAYITGINSGTSTITISSAATGGTAGQQLVAGGLYTQNLPLTIHLLTGQIPLNDNVVFGNLTEANYDGYTPQLAGTLAVINTPFPRAFGCAQYDLLIWQPTDYNVPNTITGHCWTYTPPGASAPTLVAMEVYASSVPLQQDGDILSFNPTLSIGFDETAGVPSPGIP